ncbi:MAG TPA: cadmium-translocating P-type ATPase, partial [Rhizobiales bacterium]|nr:cadmium-translocating P-type ATPase [Hyphomicrobiales bacterium]
LFFLLVGRYLDHMMRDRARSAVTRLLSLNAAGATIIDDDGEQKFIAVADLQPGMIIQVAAGERLPVDGIVISGLSDTDRSIVTGESLPYTSGPGASLEAGVLNLTGPLKIRVTATGSNTFLAGVVRLMEAAEQGKAKYMRIADRAAQIYAPAVHLLAAATFLFWLWWSGGDWHASLVAAISVLIITCPCALGLAVPAVQIVASGLLFQRGILVKDGAVLEQMTGIDTVVFDMTGTLTTGELSLAGDHGASKEEMSVAAGLAAGSTHPLAVALFRQMQASGIRPAPVKKIKELPGEGLTGIYDGKPVKLGDPQWCGATGSDVQRFDGPRTALAIDGKVAAIFSFEYRLRPAVRKTIASLTGQGMKVILLSGDHEDAVAHVAQRAGIDEWKSRLKPQDKAACIAKLQAGGAKVLMVGDGINDAPALAAASASMAPSSASDIGRTAAGLVFTAPGLDAVTTALKISRAANRHVKQNFALAILYNLIAVPVAIAGLATPLVAAIAMSSSSIIVTANALRLRLAAKDASPQKQKRGSAAPLITAASDT